MSRSRKKTPIIKDGCGENRRIHNRRWRHRNKYQVTAGKEPFLQHEIANQYEICDYRHIWTIDTERRIRERGKSEDYIAALKRKYCNK